MRLDIPKLVALVVVFTLRTGALQAQQSPAPQPAGATPGAAPLDLPVSLDRIRDALAQPAPAEPLKGLNEQPIFRLEIQERQRIEQLMEKIKFDGGGGPEVAGGRANYELQRVIFPPVDNPLVQPYAAFSTGQVLTLAAEALAVKLVAPKISRMFGGLLGAQTEREAREEVARNLAAFQAAHPDTTPKN